jgi:hypothetical protein
MSLRHLIFHNFWLKFFSIALGTVIWMAVRYSIDHDFTLIEPGEGQNLTKESIRVPISVVSLPGDTRTFKLTPDAALLTVVGEAAVLHGPERRDIRIFVDLTDFHSRTASLEELRAYVPQAVDVLDFKPHNVSVEPTAP